LKHELQFSKDKVQSSRSEVKGQRSNFETLEKPLFEPNARRIWASQEAEKEIKVHFHSLKHRFFKLTQGAFCAALKA